MVSQSHPSTDAGSDIPRSPVSRRSAEVVSDDFHIISPAGVLVMTTDCAAAARRYVMARKADLPGLAIERHIITRTVEAIYTPRPAKPAARKDAA